MQKVSWSVFGILSFVLILILFGAGMMFGDWGYRASGMMGSVGMMETWGHPARYAPLDWMGMVFTLMIPAGLILMAVFGIVWFERNGGSPEPRFP
jgi:hypothetical protein